MSVDYDYVLGSWDEEGGIPFFEPDTKFGKAHAEWVRNHGISPDWCFGIRLEGDQAVIRLARWVKLPSGAMARELIKDEDTGVSEPVFNECTVPREGFPEVPARDVIRQLREDKAYLDRKLTKAQQALGAISVVVHKYDYGRKV
jgi:hypothetical protein